MSLYLVIKSIHMLTAYLTVTLFALRLLLDAVGRPGWRQGPLRWLPHANDTVLLLAAIGLVVVTGWMPFVHHWLTAKVLLLVGYIVAGVFALKPTVRTPVRVLAAVLALGQVSLILHLAMTKPLLFAA
ncbi:MAG: SirB2 family protein [Marinobacter sp.]|uniref:SirB2 family protein n=1 Tax=Marinobacter sp. TaxID=50741 RepID=UPI00299D0D91|nr:SirB2 family protein [Marinobacter sp.]MDX1755454.1 SirB2 family protein [Marinobacter sp.]